MTTTDHANCLHPKTKAGRTACRKAGGPLAYHYKLRFDALASGEALCTDCFSNALSSAFENIQDQIMDDLNIDFTHLQIKLSEDTTFEAVFYARVYRAARSYLFDDSDLSRCSRHEEGSA